LQTATLMSLSIGETKHSFKTCKIMKAVRRNKKQEYIAELRADLDFLQENKHKVCSLHGEDFTPAQASTRMALIVEELNKVFANKSYQPWAAR
jgi:hypothetical protein